MQWPMAKQMSEPVSTSNAWPWLGREGGGGGEAGASLQMHSSFDAHVPTFVPPLLNLSRPLSK